MTEIIIKAIEGRDVDAMDQAFAIYRDVILKSEQRPEAEFRALWTRADYLFLAAMDQGEMLGMSVAWAPAESDIWLFEYAAVIPQARGRGVGANLFFASRTVIGGDRTALIEVDANLGSEEQAKRLNFYRRLGCMRLRGLEYILPLDAFGEPPPMVLLAMSAEPPASVPVFAVEDWVRRIYVEVYGKRLDDPRLARMIDPLPDDVMLEPI